MMKKRYYFVVVVVLCSVLLTGCGKPKKEEVPFSRDLKKDDPVYLSITEIEPIYGFSNARSGQLEALVCKSKSVDGLSVWLMFSAGTFNKAFPQASDTGAMGYLMERVNIGNVKYLNEVTLDEPVLLHGTVDITKEGKAEYDFPAGEPFVRVQRVGTLEK